MRISDYHILSDDDPHRLQDAVQEALDHGYELYGGPFTQDGHICQCVVRIDPAGGFVDLDGASVLKEA